MRLKCYHAQATLLWAMATICSVQPSLAWFDISKVIDTASQAAQQSFKFAKNNGYCALMECCNEVHIHSDITELRNALKTSLFGQHIADQVIVNAIGGHFKNIDHSEKPLVMSLHGLPDIKSAIAKCPKSLFVFDEVEKMPAGLFDAIVTLLDHHSYTKQLDFRRSIFIFLSNVAGPEIAVKLKSLVDRGSWREETQLHDFESTLEIASYNLVGGLYKSELIESHVIDHFVPFLPLELRHVENCIRVEYSKYTDEKLSDEMLREAITFDETGLYSNNGCKRVSKKVEALHYGRMRKEKKQEL
uniref:ATPase AAA-type core domain-containing protein n=1 Tax=Anopheles culicifacies TaxID=139723 RepID=A0A182M825_9DIPT